MSTHEYVSNSRILPTAPELHRNNTTGHDDKAAPRRPSAKRTTLMRRFSAIVSTEEHHASKDGGGLFCGAYGHIRKMLDYTYHAGTYNKERQFLHDSIIEDYLINQDFLEDCHYGDPWLIFTVGVQGAGKHYTIDRLIKIERFNLLSFVFVDPDEIRRMLPEYSTYVENSPDLLDALTQKECGYITETLTLAALQAGRNVILDGCLRQAQWYVPYIRGLRDSYPHLSVGMIHVTADLDRILDRARAHAEDTGRKLDETIIQDLALQHIPASIKIVKPEVDHCFVIRNDDRLELEGGGDWGEFTSTFVQTCAWIPGIKLRREVSEEEKKETTFSALRRPGRHRRISLFRSSAENHGSDETKYYGRFAHIRKTLDYSYHTNYRRDRQIFQDAIISDFLDAAVVKDKNGELCTTPTEHWIVFTAGAMGAGKGYTKKRLVGKGVFPLMAFVNVDPDEVRRRLPEFYLYVNEVPEQAGALTRMEAGFIAEILALAALQAGKNVLVDGSLRDSEWYKSYFIRLRREFPVLRIAIIHVTAPREAVFQRAADRALSSGRIVPKDLLVEAIEQVPKSVAILSPLVDYRVELSNAPDSDIEIVTPGQTWESFQSRWVQTCAWVPKSKRVEKKAKEFESRLSSDLDN